MKNDFSNIKYWVFDLDHTLYSPKVRLFDQIEELMTSYLIKVLNISEDRANYLRKYYWETYGTTLAGLMAEHNLDPHPYLEFVHDISLDDLEQNLELADLINSLKGEKIIYTNGSRAHAKNVSTALGLINCFSQLYGTEDADYIPKPKKQAFEKIFDLAKINPKQAIMFEDDPRNLVEPFNMGMKTVLVGDYTEGAYIDYHTYDLNSFLHNIQNKSF